MKNPLEVNIEINSTIKMVWDAWVEEDSIKIWNVPFFDWHCPFVRNDIKTGGNFNFRMEKLDSSEGFDYMGKYLLVIPFARIETLQQDGRKSIINFEENGDSVKLTEQFEPDEQTDLSLQKKFCQLVLNKFKDFIENQY